MMKADPLIYLLTGDLGYGMLDKIREDFPDRFFNVDAAEQELIGAGVGLALSGKIPICYSITPFLLYRPAEWHRNYLNRELVSVKLLGGGRDNDYAEDGFSHFSGDDHNFFKLFPHISTYWPQDISELEDQGYEWLYRKGPSYLNLKR